MNRAIVPITTNSRQPITSTPKQEQQTQSTKGDCSLKGWQEFSAKLLCQADHRISSNSCNLPIPTDVAFYCIPVLGAGIGKMSSHGKDVLCGQREIDYQGNVCGRYHLKAQTHRVHKN